MVNWSLLDFCKFQEMVWKWFGNGFIKSNNNSRVALLPTLGSLQFYFVLPFLSRNFFDLFLVELLQFLILFVGCHGFNLEAYSA
jgi:hypothetical protein